MALSDLVRLSAAEDTALYRWAPTLSSFEPMEHIRQLIKGNRMFTFNVIGLKYAYFIVMKLITRIMS